MKILIHTLTTAILLLWMAGCGEGGPSHGHGHGHGHVHGDESPPKEVELTEAVVRKLGIELESVSLQELQPTFSVPARVAFNEETMAHVGALVSGRISEMKVHIGETVKKGDVLFVIESPELGLAQNAFLQALDANATAKATVTLAQNNATVVKAAAELKASASHLTLAEKSAVVQQAEADVKSAEAMVALAENSVAIQKAQADLITAKAALVLADNNATVTAAQGKLEAAEPLLKRAEELYASGRKLAESGAIATTELKRRETAMMTADAEVVTARAALAQAKAEQKRDQLAATAAEQAATATLAQARAQQIRDITAARAKSIAASAALNASIAKKEQDIEAAKADLAAATAAMESAEAARQRDLAKAKSTFKAANANVATARNQLELFGMNEEKILNLQKNRKLAQHYTVLAPRDGTVVEREVTEGENVSPNQPHLLILADLSSVWVLLEVPPDRVGNVREGQKVSLVNPDTNNSIKAYGSGNIPVDTLLNYVSRMVDSETRTVQARVEVGNTNGQWRPGQFLTALLSIGEPKPILTVPVEAIQYVNSKPTVYVPVKDKSFAYKQQTVKTGKPTGGWMPITSGLKEGDKVVVKGSFILRAEFGKAKAGHDHSH